MKSLQGGSRGVPVLVPVRASPVPSVVRGSTWSTWEFCCKTLQQTLHDKRERGTVALRHEARCTCQCCPGLLSARPMGGRCLCCYGMPHGCDWPAPRRVSSARRSDSGQRNSPGLNAQPGAPARAGASHGACNASECSPRLAQMRPSSPPTVHRLLKKHCDECGTGDAWQAGDDAVMGCCVPSE